MLAGRPTHRLTNSGLRLIFQPMLKPAVNDWPLAASRTEIEKVRPVRLQVSEEEKAAHHAGLVGVFFRPAVVCTKDRSSRHFFLDCHSGSPNNIRALPFLHDCLAKSCELRPLH